MFELTNEQRRCFGLLPVDAGWVRLELKPSPYDQHATVAYLDGTTLRRFIESGDSRYREYEICENLSEDLRYLLPKTTKGKPVPLSATTLEKRTGIGMCLSYDRSRHGSSDIFLYSHTSQKGYFDTNYDPVHTNGIEDFQAWVETWCAETSAEDLADISRFAAQPRQHQKFREGDVFRIKINRRLYGYGRILLDYARMRKQKEPFWDILMGKPLACSAYRIVTERQDVSVEELKAYQSLPSVHMMDNSLFYGNFEIIGNLPVSGSEDYPILYGSNIHAGEQAEHLQCGKLFRRNDCKKALFSHFRNNSISFDLRFRLSVLQACIAEDSNAPYWSQDSWLVRQDLRNPQNRAELEQVCEQFGLSPLQLVKE